MPRSSKLIPATVARGLRSLVRDAIFFVTLPTAYRLGCLRRMRQDTALFVEETKTELSDNYTLLVNELRSRGLTCKFLSLGHYRLGVLAYYTRCLKLAYQSGSVRFIVLNDASAPISCLPIRGQTKVVQLWHACGAFKKFGMSTASKIFGDSEAEKERHPYYENLSLVTVSSPEVVWAYEEAMSLEGKGIVRPLGVSRTDVFFDRCYVDAACKHIDEVVPAARGKKVLLYAPTFRGDLKHPKAPSGLDLQKLCDQIGDDWMVLIKHHPFVSQRPAIPRPCANSVVDVSDRLPIEECLCRADACVTDYSSLVFEYALFGRPMAFFAYDLSDYDDWRGFYYDYDQMTPGPVVTSTDDLCHWINDIGTSFDATEVFAFRDRFMSACDGHATERIADEMMRLAGDDVPAREAL